MNDALYNAPTCHGCGGKGWVTPSYGVAAVCPICNGGGQAAQKTYTTRLSHNTENSICKYCGNAGKVYWKTKVCLDCALARGSDK